MTHLWVRAESRPNEDRVGITPDGVAALIAQGMTVTVEESPSRVIPIDDYRKAGAEIAPAGAWVDAPDEAIVFGLKELPEDGTPLKHRHIMFGHAFKGQPAGRVLLKRFKAGGGSLYDLEYLLDENGRRLAAFGYWAGFAGAAVSLNAWAAQQQGGICGPVHSWPDKEAMMTDLRAALDGTGRPRPSTIVIGANGRVGTGASDLLTAMGCSVTKWDMAETASGGPFPEILMHGVFINAILANPGCPVFVPAEAVHPGRALSVIGDVACDPTSEFSPIKVYDRTTTWAEPVLRVTDHPVLDVMAIDNLPSMLPRESSLDYAAQLLPVLSRLDAIDAGPWGGARELFIKHQSEV
jgi:saccharopine dehydrogenase (NAD+, L-lysine-forming)